MGPHVASGAEGDIREKAQRFARIEGHLPALGRLDGRLLALIVFLGVPGGALAFLLRTWALSRLTPTQVAVYVNLNPVVAALPGIWLLGERRSAAFALAFAAVVAGVVLVNWPQPAVKDPVDRCES